MTTTQEIKIEKTNDITPTRVCFVCTGNTCRSPMAAAVLNHLGKGSYIAESAGIMADKGAPINPKAKEALEKSGIQSSADNNYNQHIARQLDMGIMDTCDIIVGVGAGHAMMIMQSFPLCASKVTCFEKNITDPFSQSQETYDKCLSEITDCIKSMFTLTDSGEENE